MKVKKVVMIFIALAIMSVTTVLGTAATKTETNTKNWCHSIEISDEPVVVIEPVDIPTAAHRGDLIRLSYRLINEREDWSIIEWKAYLPEGARIQTTTYSEFPSMYSTLIYTGKNNEEQIMMPPKSRGFVTIMVILPKNITLDSLSISVEFSDEAIYLPPEIEEQFREMRKPPAGSLQTV